MNAYEILVIILSVTLAIFLVLAIVATALFIRFMKDIKEVPSQISGVLDDLSEVSGAVKDVASPLIALGDLVAKFFPGKKRR